MRELEAIAEVFGGGGGGSNGNGDAPNNVPVVGSTKSLSGHALGAAGVNETIYTLLMMREGFIAASANIQNLDPEATGHPIVTERRDAVDLRVAMSNSFGFGGTNSTLVFKRWAE